jgi:putative ABC transport system ATP-binding protein
MDTLFSSSTLGLVNNHRLLIQLCQVVKVYKTAAGDFTALKGITADIHAGEFVGVIGKSGAGKSTLLNMITGADMITSGEVIFNPPDGKSTSIHKLSENSMAVWRGRNVGIIHQSFQLLPMLNLVENIMLPVDFSGRYRPRITKERAIELLRLVELEDHASKLPAYISGGQKQRVAIARSLANDPPIIVADEPTGSLDTLTAETIFEIFEKLIEEGRTIIMVTHDNNLGPRFTRRLMIADGQIESDSGFHITVAQVQQ